MSEDGLVQTPAVFSSKERAALVARALSEAARRARFSTKKRKNYAVGGGYRAKRSEVLFKRLVIGAFVGVVAVPTLIAAIYFGFVASNQYTAEARFTVRGGLPASMDAMGALTGAPSMLIIQDTQVIMNYLQSRAVVEALDKSIDLKALYRKEGVDFFSRLRAKASIEKTLAYWKKHTILTVQMPSGIVVFTVKAFSPSDAVLIANAALDSSEKLVNDMNAHMIADALSLAQSERQRAQTNLAETQAKLEKARNQEGILSAEASSTAIMTLMAQVKSQLLKMQEEYDSQRKFVSADAPQLLNLKSKIEAAKIEADKLQGQMTQDKASGGESDHALAGSMSRLDYAQLNNQIAGSIYAGALTAVEQAHLASELKMMYINVFVRPADADQSKYPERGEDIAITAAASLAAWGVVVMGLKLTRNYFS